MNGRIGWDDQRAFLAVLEEGSLSAAARRLGIAQPTVRARIEALEQGLGTVLFTRSVNGLVPTEQARALAEPARAMARSSEAFVRAASAPPGKVAGAVRLSVAEFVGVEVLPPMLASLHERHPEIVAEVSLSNSSADLIDQEVDIAVRMYPPRQEALIAKKVGAIALGMFAHREYVERCGLPGTLADLTVHRFVGPDRSQADLRFVGARLPNLSRQSYAARTDSHPAQLAFARAGLGIAIVQRPIGKRDPLLVPILPDLDIGSLDICIVTHENLRNIPRVAAMFDHLVDAFTSYTRQP